MADQYPEYLVFWFMIVYCVFVVFCRLAAFGSQFQVSHLLKGVTEDTDLTDILACRVYFPPKVNKLHFCRLFSFLLGFLDGAMF